MSAKKPKHADQWLQIYKEHPMHARHWWVAVLALIRKNSTGEVREYPTHEILEGDETHPSTYVWEEGGFACDCNRRLFFTNHEDQGEYPCGELAYSVNLVNPVTGEAYYKEFEQ